MNVPGPEGLNVSRSEIEDLLQLGNVMIPGVASARVLRAFCGVRALYAREETHAVGGREVSRSFALIDHEAQDGVRGLISIVGGKLTTYRKMAASVCDCVSIKLGVDSECSTDKVPLRSAIDRKTHRRAMRILSQPVAEKLELRLGPEAARVVEAIELRPELAELACECELVTRAELEYVLGNFSSAAAQTIADVGRRTRLGFGPCQGTFCGYKAMLAGFQTRRWSASQAATEFSSYLDERWKGQSFISHGQQVEQLAFSENIYREHDPVCANTGELDE
jgi:glycerol-3-phosphate dehydrogenase